MPAWAVGEHIAVTGPAKEQLSETLCISMECVKGAHDFTVTSKVVGKKMELKVLGPSGDVKFSMKQDLNEFGRLSSSDAMSATSLLVHAIENPSASKAAMEKPAKKKKLNKWAKSKRKLNNPVRVAARMRSRG